MIKPRLAFTSAPPPEQSPERAVLAEKIAQHQSALTAIAKLEAAVSQATNRVYDAVYAIEAAEKALANGPELARDWEVASALGTDPGPAIDMARLRATLAEKQEQADIKREARGQLEAALGRAKTDARWTEEHVKTAALAVLKTAPNLTKIIADIEALQAALVERGRELSDLVLLGVLAKKDEANNFTHARNVDERFYIPPASWLDLLKAKPPANRWKNAFAALCQDANAALPE